MSDQLLIDKLKTLHEKKFDPFTNMGYHLGVEECLEIIRHHEQTLQSEGKNFTMGETTPRKDKIDHIPYTRKMVSSEISVSIDDKALEIAAEVIHLEDSHAMARRVIEAYEAAKVDKQPDEYAAFQEAIAEWSIADEFGQYHADSGTLYWLWGKAVEWTYKRETGWRTIETCPSDKYVEFYCAKGFFSPDQVFEIGTRTQWEKTATHWRLPSIPTEIEGESK